MKLIMEQKMFSKSFIVGILILVFGSVTLFSQGCPAGMVYGGKVIVPSQDPNCYWEADYCLSNGVTITGTCDVHFTTFKLINTGAQPCNLPVDINGNYVVPTSELLKAVIFRDLNCFPGIYPCEESTWLHARVSHGGCYDITFDPITWETTYTPCESGVQRYCKTYYKICKEMIDGKWEYVVTNGPAEPAFFCEGDCDVVCGD